MSRSETVSALNKPADRYVFVARSKWRLVTIALLLLSVAGLGFGIYLDATVAGRPALVLTVASALLTVGFWGWLQARIPQRIEVDRAIITIVRSGHREQAHPGAGRPDHGHAQGPIHEPRERHVPA